MEFVAFVGEDKENWGQLTALMNRMDTESIVLVMPKQVSGFPINEKCKVITIDSTKSLSVLKEDLLNKLRTAVKGEFEVAISLASGTGKEHMALIAALLSVPVGVRLVVYTKEGIQFLS